MYHFLFFALIFFCLQNTRYIPISYNEIYTTDEMSKTFQLQLEWIEALIARKKSIKLKMSKNKQKMILRWLNRPFNHLMFHSLIVNERHKPYLIAKRFNISIEDTCSYSCKHIPVFFSLSSYHSNNSFVSLRSNTV